MTVIELVKSKDKLKKTGNSIVESWKAIIHGHVADPKAEAALLKFKQERINLIRNAINQVYKQKQTVEAQTKDYQVQIEVFEHKLHGTVAEIVPQIKSFRNKVKNISTLSLKLQPQIIKMTIPVIASYRAVETEIESLQQGHLPKPVTNNLQTELTDKLTNASVIETAKHIAGIMRMANAETNHVRQQQLREVLSTVVDEQGIIKQWQGNKNITFHAPKDTPLGIAIRQNYNEALGYFATQTTTRLKAKLGLQMVQDADTHFANGNSLWGNRLLNRARVVLDFIGGDTNAYQNIKSTPAAQDMFGFSVTGDDFEGYELAAISNKLANVKNRLSAEMHFLGVLAVKQANNYQHFSEPTLFTTMLDNAYAVFDMANGFMQGIWRGFDETAAGILNTINHPIDSASAIYSAIANYEKTYKIIATEAKKFLKQFPNSTAKQYGELAGRITFEIGTYFSGIGAIKKLKKVSKVALQIQKIAKETSILANAAKTAFKAADNIASWKASKLKIHMPGTPQKQKSTFLINDVDEVRSIVVEALKSPNAVFMPNKDHRAFRVVTDLGRKIGTKGQTRIRVTVDHEGNIWNAFPVKVK